MYYFVNTRNCVRYYFYYYYVMKIQCKQVNIRSFVIFLHLFSFYNTGCEMSFSYLWAVSRPFGISKQYKE